MHHPAQERPALFDAVRECADVLRSRIVSRKLLASFADEHEEGDFIVHFADGSIDAKLAGVARAIASATGASRRSSARPPLSAPTPVRDLLPRNPPANRKSARVRRSTALPPIYCITCRQTPERTRLARKHFSTRRLDVQFFPGIHGKTFGLSAGYNGASRMLAEEIGRLLSHYMLWQTLAYLPHEEILILEDDARILADFPIRFRRAYRDLPRDWQFVFLGAVATEAKRDEQIADSEGVMSYPSGLHAYLVKRSVLPFLLETNHQAAMPIDRQLMTNSLPAIKCFTFVPALVKQRQARRGKQPQ
jgi:GR25 family glycosyltransferase involved in LPS biosynthesis